MLTASLLLRRLGRARRKNDRENAVPLFRGKAKRYWKGDRKPIDDGPGLRDRWDQMPGWIEVPGLRGYPCAPLFSYDRCFPKLTV